MISKSAAKWRRPTYGLVALLLFGQLGCGKTEPTGQTEANVSAVTETETASAEPIDRQKLEAANTRDLLQAATAERRGDVVEAREAWERIRRRLLDAYGDDYWELRTVDVGLEQLARRTAMTLAERTTLLEIDEFLRRSDLRAAEGDTAAALTAIDEAFKRAREVWGEGAPVTLEVQLKQGLRRAAAGDAAGAEASFQAATQGRSSLLGAEHPLTLEAQGEFIRFLQQQQRLDEALALAERRLSGAKKSFVEPHAAIAEARNDLGCVFYAAGRWDEAAQELGSSLSMRRALGASTSEPIALGLRNLALVHIAQQRTQDAIPLLDEAIELSSGFGDTLAVAELKLQRGTCYLAGGDAVAAEGDYREARQSYLDVRAMSPKLYAESCFKLGYALGRQGRYVEAEPVLEEALEIQRIELPESDPARRRTEEIAALVRAKLDASRVGANDSEVLQR